jgi:hypothetical protein
MLRRAPLVLPLLLAVALAACGDGSLGAAELRTQAATICSRTAASTDRIPVPSEPSQGARFLRAGLAQLGPANARLRALKAPSKLRDNYTKVVALGRDETALIAHRARAIDGGADAIIAFRALQRQLAPLTREENAYWRALQIPACVSR